MSYFTSTIYIPSSASSFISPDVSTPLQLKSKTDTNFKFKQNVVRYEDGYSLNKANLFNNTKDVKTNKNSLLNLSTSTIQSEFVEENTFLTTAQDYIDLYGFAYTYIGTELSPTKFWTIDSITKKLILSDDNDEVNIFKISKTNQGYTLSTILSGAEKYFSVDTTQYNTIFITELLNEDNIIQHFNISFNNNIVSFRFKDKLSEKTIGIKDNEIGVRVASVHSARYDYNNNKQKPQQFRLFYENLTEYENNTLHDKNQSWIHYFNELNDKENDKNVNINKDKSVDNIPVNYLVVTPYETKINTSGHLDVELVPLKNMMTPEGNYAAQPFSTDDGSVLSDLEKNLQPKRREYNKLYTGENSSTDYDKILTGFTSNTQLFTIPAGETTYFHYPFEAKILPLSASGLIEAGALPGSTPATSDRIFKKNAKYKNFKYWGESQQNFGCDDGVWLCAWLSGSNGSSLEGLNNGVWIDRWYNPSKISSNNALSAGFTELSIQENDPVFFDVSSELTLDPGVWYKYTRLGTQDLEFIVNTFDANKNLLLHYKDDWGELVEDKSTYNNIGNIPRFALNQINETGPAEGELEQVSININDGSYIQIPQSDTTNLTGSFTIACWLKSDNWEQNPGSALIQTNFRSGASINYTNQFYNPTVSVIEQEYGHVLQYSQCAPISDSKVSLVSGSEVVSQVVTDDLYTYVLDNINKLLVKIEYSGEVVNTKTFNNNSNFNESSLLLSQTETLFVYDYNNNQLHNINPIDLTTISTTQFNSGPEKILLDNYGNIIRGNWIDAVVDNENRIYTIEHSTLEDDYNKIGFDAAGPSFFGPGTSTITQIIETGYTHILCRYEGPEEKTSNNQVLISTLDREVITFTNEFYEEVQFQSLYPGSGINGIISKPFNPNKLLFTRDDFLYIFNDTRELIKLEVNKTKPLRLVFNDVLFNFSKMSGKNLFDLTDPLLENQYDEFINFPLWASISANNISTISPGVTWEFNSTSQQYENYLWLVEEQSRAMYKTNKDLVIVECFSLPDAVDKLAYPNEDTSLYNFTIKPATTYEWHRKFSWLKNNKEDFGLNAHVYTLSGPYPIKYRLTYNGPSLANGNWYHTSLSYNSSTGSLEFYVDNVLTDSIFIPTGLTLFNLYSNGITIGSNLLRSNAINEELNCNMYSFDGSLYDIRIYNTYLTQNQQAQIILSNLKIDDMQWNIPVGARQYIEQIERFFKHKTPGNHSQYFNIRLSGLKIYDVSIRKDIEDIIRKTISKTAPAYVSLLRIEWDD